VQEEKAEGKRRKRQLPGHSLAGPILLIFAFFLLSFNFLFSHALAFGGAGTESARATRKTIGISRIQGKICTESNASMKLDCAKRQLFSLQSILPFFEALSESNESIPEGKSSSASHCRIFILGLYGHLFQTGCF
jgi:hypothetical protein